MRGLKLHHEREAPASACVGLTCCPVWCFDCVSSDSASKSEATAKVMRKAKMVMTMARMAKPSDTASSNPVFQLLNEGADAKQQGVRLPCLAEFFFLYHPRPVLQVDLS